MASSIRKGTHVQGTTQNQRSLFSLLSYILSFSLKHSFWKIKGRKMNVHLQAWFRRGGDRPKRAAPPRRKIKPPPISKIFTVFKSFPHSLFKFELTIFRNNTKLPRSNFQNSKKNKEQHLHTFVSDRIWLANAEFVFLSYLDSCLFLL
jgi:hypothetical protein